MLSKVVSDYLDERFPRQFDKVAPTEGFTPFLRFKAKCSEFGDIELYDDGDEVTIFFGRFTHSHYGNYEEIPLEEKELHIAEDVFEALNDTFNDRLEFWGSHEGGGGFREVEATNEGKLGILSRIFSRGASKTCYRWSGSKRQTQC